MEGNLIFTVGGYPEMIKLCANGDIFVKGNLVTNDQEIIDGFREFLNLSGILKPKVIIPDKCNKCKCFNFYQNVPNQVNGTWCCYSCRNP